MDPGPVGGLMSGGAKAFPNVYARLPAAGGRSCTWVPPNYYSLK